MSAAILTDDMAFRIGMASRALPGVALDQWIGILIRAVGLPLSPERVKKLRLKRLRQSGGKAFGDFTDEQLREALSLLRGQGIDLSITVPVPKPYRPGDMPGSIRVACASNRGDRIDAPFGNCTRFLIYQVSVSEIRLIESRDAATGGKPVERYARRAEQISDCPVLCALTIGATAASSVVRVGIHPLKLGVPKQAGEYLSGLQDVMAGSPPPWLDNLMRGSDSLTLNQDRTPQPTADKNLKESAL